MDLMFSVNDKSGDGIIDVDEYTQVYSNYGISTRDCHQSYDKFSAVRRSLLIGASVKYNFAVSLSHPPGSKITIELAPRNILPGILVPRYRVDNKKV